MGKRKGRKNNGGGHGGNKTHNNHQNDKILFGGDRNNNELQLASKFTPRKASENDDGDDFFANEIVEDVLAQAMFHYILEGGELDEESFESFFLEHYMGKLYVKCAKKQHWYHGRPNVDYGFETSSDDDDDDDDIDFGFRFSNISNEPPCFSYKPKRQNGNPKKGKNKKGRGRLNDQVTVQTLIKLLIIKCVLEEEGRRNKRFRWK